jgi:hypothetical protein
LAEVTCFHAELLVVLLTHLIPTTKLRLHASTIAAAAATSVRYVDTIANVPTHALISFSVELAVVAIITVLHTPADAELVPLTNAFLTSSFLQPCAPNWAL